MPQRPDALERGDHASHENTEHDQGTLYEVDSYTWALRQAGPLRERRAAALDWDNLAEEVEDLAGRHRDAITSYLARVLRHLWKLKFWHALLKGNERIWRSEV